MTLTQMNYIITIFETGSLNKAAEALYISQPSLTNAVKELEKELGIIIFNRSGRGVTLTARPTSKISVKSTVRNHMYILRWLQALTQFSMVRQRTAG